MQKLEPVVVQGRSIAYPLKGKVTTHWEYSKFDFGTPSPKTFERDVIHVQAHYGQISIEDVYKPFTTELLDKTSLIPSDLVPEVLAVSLTSVLSIIGIAVAVLVFSASATVFLAPLIASLLAGVFLWRTIRSRS